MRGEVPGCAVAERKILVRSEMQSRVKRLFGLKRQLKGRH